MFGAVFGYHQHAVAAAYAVGVQFAFEPVGQRADVRVGEAAVGHG